MTFNPNGDEDVGNQNSSGEHQQSFTDQYQYIPPAERVQFSPFSKGRAVQ